METADAQRREASKLLKEWGLLKSGVGVRNRNCVLVTGWEGPPKDAAAIREKGGLMNKFKKAQPPKTP